MTCISVFWCLHLSLAFMLLIALLFLPTSFYQHGPEHPAVAEQHLVPCCRGVCPVARVLSLSVSLLCCAYGDHVGRELLCARVEVPATVGPGVVEYCCSLRVVPMSDSGPVCSFARRVMLWVFTGCRCGWRAQRVLRRVSFSDHDAWSHWRHHLAASGGVDWLVDSQVVLRLAG